jgi:aspartate dehydrogenase
MANNEVPVTIKAGMAGVGAIGSVVCKSLKNNGITGMTLAAVSDLRKDLPFDVPNLSFAELADKSDVVIEALPPDIVPDLAKEVLLRGKILVMISGAALLRFPEIREWAEKSSGRIIVPSGALAGIDGVRALKSMGLKSAAIRSTKKPKGFEGAPYVVKEKIDLSQIDRPQRIFAGNAYDAAQAFPANVNVAAILSLAGLGPEKTTVEVWADPQASGNIHEISLEGTYSSMTARTENQPDPANPKTSVLAAHSIIACLRQMTEKVSII